MVTRAEKKAWLPSRADAFALCNNVTNGNCTCRAKGKNPCSAWRMILTDCHVNGITNHAEAERMRMKYNRQVNGNCIAIPTPCLPYLRKKEAKP